ncbi:MAG: aspartate-semialdehyde dehydrogenase [Deltaproteobacteria bacterium]
MTPQHVVVVGATGAVGQEMLKTLAQRRFPMASLRLVASPASAGRTVHFDGKDHTLLAPSRAAFEGATLALFSAGASVSREWGPVAASCGALVVDNSSAFRMDTDVPLVIPEVNPEAMATRPRGIIANPNCSTIQMLVALKPLHDAARIEHIVVSTYQAISGKGARALAELEAQTAQDARGETPTHSVLPGVLAFNVLSDWKHEDSGYSEEESKIIAETRKILGMPGLHVSPTTVRVPVRNAHSESVWVRFARPITRDEALALLRKAPGVQVDDRIGAGLHPQPRLVTGQDDVFVGRVRQDPDDPTALALFIVGDNIRKGAALNAVQIAEKVLG